jgi:hypothetical protein
MNGDGALELKKRLCKEICRAAFDHHSIQTEKN